MEKQNEFSVKKIIGEKIYRYVDNNGQKGRVHVSTTFMTPLECENQDGKNSIRVGFKHIIINNMEELDSINNALNNPKKTIQMIERTPSVFIAETNPDLYLKIIDAIRESLIYGVRGKKDGLEMYAILSFLVNKEAKIKAKMREKIINDAEKKEKTETPKERE